MCLPGPLVCIRIEHSSKRLSLRDVGPWSWPVLWTPHSPAAPPESDAAARTPCNVAW